VSFAAITLSVALNYFLLLFISLSTQSGNFWIHSRTAFQRIKSKADRTKQKVKSYIKYRNKYLVPCFRSITNQN